MSPCTPDTTNAWRITRHSNKARIWEAGARSWLVGVDSRRSGREVAIWFMTFRPAGVGAPDLLELRLGPLPR